VREGGKGERERGEGEGEGEGGGKGRERERGRERNDLYIPGRFPAKTPLNCSSKLSVSPLESLTFILKMCSSSEKSNRLIVRGNEPNTHQNTLNDFSFLESCNLNLQFSSSEPSIVHSMSTSSNSASHSRMVANTLPMDDSHSRSTSSVAEVDKDENHNSI
jgi:hypothetical protein